MQVYSLTSLLLTVVAHSIRPPNKLCKFYGLVVIQSKTNLFQIVGDGGSVLTQTVAPHRDFFMAQFLLAFPVGGQYLLIVEASVIDEKSNVWRTGPRTTLTVKSHEEGSKLAVTTAVQGAVAGTSAVTSSRGNFPNTCARF